jgi:hypothetical protein
MGIITEEFVKKQKYDKYYLSEDICCPLVKGFHKEGILNRKTDSPHVKYLGICVDPPWERCLKEPTWQTKDTKMGCTK